MMRHLGVMLEDSPCLISTAEYFKMYAAVTQQRDDHVLRDAAGFMRPRSARNFHSQGYGVSIFFKNRKRASSVADYLASFIPLKEIAVEEPMAGSASGK